MIVSVSSVFQFHYGTIKRQYGGRRKLAEKLFQFHYGTIKSSLGIRGMSVYMPISIPLWYD